MNVLLRKSCDAKISGTEPIEIDPKQAEVRYGDVFFTTSSETPEEVGMSSIWLENVPNTYLNSFCFGFRMKNPLDFHFFAYALRSPCFRKQMILLAQGISRYNISKISSDGYNGAYPTRARTVVCWKAINRD
ncbi:MAG: hypothetical protein ACOX24_00270 [Christensenellales bacterium]